VFFSFLSLSSFLSMAPKKSIPLRNTISCCGFSSSYSPSILDSMRFCDEKAKQDFYDNFSDRAIHSEPQVILSNFLDTPLPSVFNSRGWASLCEIPKRCPGVFIQEFHCNMHAIDTFVPRFTRVFRGTRIVVTPEFISEVL